MLTSDHFESVTGALFLKTKGLRRIEPSSRTADRRVGLQLWDLSVRMNKWASPRQKQKACVHSRQRDLGEVGAETSRP
jgi:hypothetical protein